MRMEVHRLQKSILAKRQYLAVINKAKDGAMEQLHRKQLEHGAAREMADCDREKDHREHQARMRDLLEREREEEEYLARIYSELRCDELQVHFQRIHPRRRSRSPLPPQFCYPATPITSSSLSYSSQSDNSYQNHQQYYPASQDVRATLLPTPPIRVQSFVKSNFSSTAADTVYSHVPRSPSPTVLVSSSYSNYTKPTSFKHSRYATDQPPSQSVTNDFDPLPRPNTPAPVSE